MPGRTHVALRAMLLLGALVGYAQAQQAPPPSHLHPTNRVIVRFREDVAMATSVDQHGLEFQSAAGSNGAVVYKITDSLSVEEKIQQLKSLPSVADVEPDYRVSVQALKELFPDDTAYARQWHHSKISTPAAWATSTGSQTVKVCHVDSGVRIDHPDLAPNVLKGWNLVPAGQADGMPPPAVGTPEYSNYNDTYGHGTHTAGIIGAVGNNLRGVAGVNWNVKLLVCRFIWNDGAGFISDAMTCIKLCRAEGAMITSNSWGGIGYSKFLDTEIVNSQSAGQLFVVASGNNYMDLDTTPLYPASYKTDNMISVAASGTSDGIATFSNVGKNTVHLTAPGEAIYSTAMDGGYKLMWGTSMACPMVAGTAALLQSIALGRGTTLNYADLKQLLVSTTDATLAAKDRTITGGRLNVASAVTALQALLDKRGAPPLSAIGAASPPPPSPLPSPPPVGTPPPPPSTATTATTDSQTMPSCGKTPMFGGTAQQSSTTSRRNASLAMDGMCRNKLALGSCAQTKKQAGPWWVGKLRSPSTVSAVRFRLPADCSCFADAVAGAKVVVGNATWTGRASATEFTYCGRVASKVGRGQTVTVECNLPPGTVVQQVAIIASNTKTVSLGLCEVDVVPEGVSAASVPSPAMQPAPVAEAAPVALGNRKLRQVA